MAKPRKRRKTIKGKGKRKLRRVVGEKQSTKNVEGEEYFQEQGKKKTNKPA